MTDTNPVVLSYDTTYNLGDCYVSALLYRHFLFENSPTIPVAFYLHERKKEETHEDFFREISRQVPLLLEKDVPIIVDRELAITKGIETIFPNWTVLNCWNHLKRDVRYWVNKQDGGTNEQANAYVSDISRLLQCSTLEEFETQQEDLSEKWASDFDTHFKTNLKRDILKSCRFEVEKFHLYNPYSGVTNNASEGYNTVLSNLQDWPRRPVDCIALSLYYLQQYQVLEINRGLAGVGNYKLRKEFQYCAINRVDIDLENKAKAGSPEEIIDYIKNSDKLPFPDQNISTIDPQQALEDQDQENQPPSPPNPPPSDHRSTSQLALAQGIVRSKGITHCPQLGAFMVKSASDNLYAVKLHPKESCQCPATVTCQHIMAVKISVGMPVEPRAKTVNLANLRRNARKKTQKRAGKQN